MNESIPHSFADDFVYRQIFDLAGDAIIVCSEDGRAVDCNRAASELFGCDRGQLIGSKPVDWSPEYQPNGCSSAEMAAEVFRRAGNEERVRFDWENVRADGSRLPVEVTVSLARIGKRRLFVIVSRDMSVFRRMERDLRLSEEKFFRAFHDSPEPMLIAEVDTGRIHEMNRSFTATFGYSPEVAIGRTTLEIGLWPDMERRNEVVAMMKNHGVLRNVEVAQRCRDGRIVTAIASASRLESDGIGYWLVHLHDITERANTEKALQESRDHFKKVIEQSPLSMALVSMDGTIDYINRKAIETFGYLPGDIPVMERWWALAYPDEAYRAEVVAQWTGLVEKALLHNHEIERREYRVTCKDGSVKVVSIFGVWVANQVLAIFEDVTARHEEEQRRLQAERDLRMALHQVEQKERSKSRFLAATSHDLRQPLYAAQLFADALGQGPLDDGQQASVRNVRQALQSMSEQLQMLLHMSRLEDSDVRIERIAIPAVEFLAGMADIYMPIARRAGVRLVLHAGGHLLHTDQGMLSRLVGNLIDNAVKFSPRGTVLVCVRRRQAGCLIQVRDNGQGIADIDHSTIFDDFYQIGNSARDPKAGYGLGLSIVSRIAKVLGATVQVRSAVGCGSVFSVLLPA